MINLSKETAEQISVFSEFPKLKYLLVMYSGHIFSADQINRLRTIRAASSKCAPYTAYALQITAHTLKTPSSVSMGKIMLFKIAFVPPT